MNKSTRRLTHVAATLLGVGLCAISQADEKEVSALPGSLGLSSHLIGVTVNLCLVLGAIILFAWIFKRAQGFGQPASGSLRVTATLPLSPKERILLVQVGDDHIVVGASPAGLSTLHVLGAPPTELPATPVPTESFKEKLLKSLRGAQA